MVSNNVEFLTDAGPTPSEELPFTQKRADEIDGLRVFTLSETTDSSKPRGGQSTDVTYLDRHDNAEVVRTYIEANLHLIENYDKPTLVRVFRYVGPSWSDAASEVLRDYYDTEQTHQTFSGPAEGTVDTCPFCVSDVSKGALRSHLARECDEA